MDTELEVEVTETEDALLPPALQNADKWEEEIDPRQLVLDNIRPIDLSHVYTIQDGYRTRGGFDDEIEVVQFVLENETVYKVFDGGHRLVAILGNPDLGVSGLIDEEVYTDDFDTVPVTVYSGDHFRNDLDFLFAQFIRNSSRRNIDDVNAADQAHAVFRLLEAGATPYQVKEITKKSRGWVSLMARAHEKSIAELKHAVREGLISGKTLVDGSMLESADQKKMLKEILNETQDLPVKKAQSVERKITDTYLADSKAKAGGTPRFPKAMAREEFKKTASRIFQEFSNENPENLLPSDNREEMLVSKGILQGIMLAFGISNAQKPDWSVRAIQTQFKKITGQSITSE